MKKNKQLRDYCSATHHSVERTIERADMNEKEAMRFISLAIERGKSSREFHSDERSYLESKAHEDGCRAVVYNGYVFILGKHDRCVTMYKLPTWFGKKKNYDGKQKVRNAKKYCAMNRYDDENDYVA